MADGTGLPGRAEAVLAAFDQSAFMLYAVEGPDYRIAAYNDTLVRLFGPGTIGMPVREAFAMVDAQRFFDLYDEVYTSGEPRKMHAWRIQLPGPDGVPVELYIDFAFTPWRNADGAVVGVIGSVNDVTDLVAARLAAERERAATEGRYRAARDTVTTLQGALLPQDLPVLPGCEVLASYLLADGEDAAGGDWFDALVLEDGRVALVVGDVVGHGVGASVTMGQLRVVLAERLVATGDLVEALQAVDQLATWLPGERAATVCVAVLDTSSGALSYVTAGHPPPLLLGAGDHARFLMPSGAGPLPTGSVFAPAYDQLRAADMLLLYTDGILERPDRALSAATVELAAVASDVAGNRAFTRDPGGPADRLTTQTLELLTRVTGHDDDITLLAAARRTPVPALSLRFPSDLTSIVAVRVAVRTWVDRLGTGEADRVALEHAVEELVANAWEHAHPTGSSPGRTIAVTADLLVDGTAEITVFDDGRWHDAPSGDSADSGDRRRGFGLAMAAALADELAVDRSATGTVVTVRRQLSRSAHLLGGAQATAPRPRPDGLDEDLTVVEQPGVVAPRIAVVGALDATNAEDLGAELDHRTRAGTRTLTVDLSGVTHLGSAAVAELHRASRTPDGPALLLFAPLGSTAHHVLGLVQLPHTTTDPDVLSSGVEPPF